jgi:hypothetical protein
MERKIDEIRLKDRAWIEQNASRGMEICESYGITQKEPSPADLDRVFKAWKEDQRSDKVNDTDIINGLGCLFGELMCDEFGLQWKIVTDDFGTALALRHLKSSWETYPQDFVAKRVEAGNDEVDFFKAMQSLMHDKLYQGT